LKNKAFELRERLASGKIVRIMGAHNGLGARLIERHHFDAVWASGLEISTAYGLPDANILTMTENLEAARAINEATCLPVVCDCDTGYGNATQVMHMVRRYEAAGIAAVVIEDKCFPKINSLLAARQELVSLEEFAGKIQAACQARSNPDFLVIARVEALIAGLGQEEALRRANAYADAGADAVVIHSKAKTPEEIFLFAKEWKRPVPLVAIPTTYFKVTAPELEKAGFSMVIYANQGLRASIRAMQGVFDQIDREGTSASVEAGIATLGEVFELQGMQDMQQDEERFVRGESIQAVIPAARDHRFQPDLAGHLKDTPLCMLDIGGRSLLERQMDLLSSAGVGEVFVVGGHLERPPPVHAGHRGEIPAGAPDGPPFVGGGRGSLCGGRAPARPDSGLRRSSSLQPRLSTVPVRRLHSVRPGPHEGEHADPLFGHPVRPPHPDPVAAEPPSGHAGHRPGLSVSSFKAEAAGPGLRGFLLPGRCAETRPGRFQTNPGHREEHPPGGTDA